MNHKLEDKEMKRSIVDSDNNGCKRTKSENGAVDFEECIYNEDVERVATELRRQKREIDNWMFLAIREGKPAIVKELLKDGRIELEGKKGGVLAGIALLFDHEEVALRILEDPRVNPSEPRNQVLVEAAEGGHMKVFKKLMEDNRVDPTAQACRAYKGAAREGRWEIVKIFLEDKRVDVMAEEGIVLKQAKEAGREDIVSMINEMVVAKTEIINE